MTAITVRDATSADADEILLLIKELAEYENLSDKVHITSNQLTNDINKKCRVKLAVADNKIIGYALYTPIYLSFSGSWLYLDDLYVKQEFRGSGAGRKLLRAVGGVAIQEEHEGLKWFVLDWNQPAMDFYARAGAVMTKDWYIEKVTGRQALVDFVNKLA